MGVRVCFLGNLCRIEQRGAYGEIKGLGESDDEGDDERERKMWTMDSLAEAQYAQTEKATEQH